MQQGESLEHEPAIDPKYEPPSRTVPKIVAALFICGVFGALSLLYLLESGEPAAPDPNDAFEQLTGWQLPPGTEILENSNTHGGLTNDGDFVLTVRLRPRQLQGLIDSDSKAWCDCPVAPEIVRAATGLPEHSGSMYFAGKTMASDTDWHRGHVVIVNPKSGTVWIYEWKG